MKLNNLYVFIGKFSFVVNSANAYNYYYFFFDKFDQYFPLKLKSKLFYLTFFTTSMSRQWFLIILLLINWTYKFVITLLEVIIRKNTLCVLLDLFERLTLAHVMCTYLTRFTLVMKRTTKKIKIRKISNKINFLLEEFKIIPFLRGSLGRVSKLLN